MTTSNKNKDSNHLNQLKGIKAKRYVNNMAYIFVIILISHCISGVRAEEDDHEHEDEEHDDHEEDERDFSKGTGWFYGILFSFCMAVIGLLCSVVVVFLKMKTSIDFKPIISVLIAFAAGSLIGDSIVHLIPSGFGIHSHEEDGEEAEEINENVMTLMICVGFVCFFIIEKVLEFFHIGHNHGIEDKEKVIPFQKLEQNKTEVESPSKRQIQNDNDNNQMQNVELSNKQPKEIQPTDEDNNRVVAISTTGEGQQIVKQNSKENNIANLNGQQSQSNMLERQSTSASDDNKGWKNKKTEGYINLIGDFFHNILDGLALGAIVSGGQWSSIASTMVAIIAHEIPQEIGDVGILLHSNFSNFQVILCNGAVNFSAMIGCIIGLALGELNDKSDRLMTLFVAGSFLYLGASDMLPAIKSEKNKKIALLQFFFFLLGIGVMYFILIFESHEEHDHEEHADEEEDHDDHDHRF